MNSLEEALPTSFPSAVMPTAEFTDFSWIMSFMWFGSTPATAFTLKQISSNDDLIVQFKETKEHCASTMKNPRPPEIAGFFISAAQ